MTRNPRISFGLSAYHAANKADMGRVGLRDRLALAARALALPEGESEARQATVQFLRDADGRPSAAARRYRAFFDCWLQGIAPDDRREVERAEVAKPLRGKKRPPEAKAAHEDGKPSPRYNWQDRADAGDG